MSRKNFAFSAHDLLIDNLRNSAIQSEENIFILSDDNTGYHHLARDTPIL